MGASAHANGCAVDFTQAGTSDYVGLPEIEANCSVLSTFSGKIRILS